MTVCFVILRASGRGGLTLWSDFGPAFGVKAWGLFSVATCWEGSVVSLLHLCLVTGMKVEVAVTYEIGAVVRAVSFGKSSGVEGAAWSVLMGGALVNLTDLPLVLAALPVILVVVMLAKNLKKPSWDSGNPSAVLKFCSA